MRVTIGVIVGLGIAVFGSDYIGWTAGVIGGVVSILIWEKKK